MFKSLSLFPLLALVATANAQSDPQTPAQQQPAPIVRAYHRGYRPAPPNQIVESQPTAGVWLRSDSASSLKTISATPKLTEIRLERGRLNVSVHHPAEHAEIVVDLPGGQVSLFKDGLYTLNADTNTVRVLHGEAAAYPGPISPSSNAKPIKVKEYHQLSLVAATAGKPSELKSVEAYPYELSADLLPSGYPDEGRGYGDYGDGNPYYAGAWGGYPYYGDYAYGYPLVYGIGFGYYGGFGGGYYRGGLRR